MCMFAYICICLYIMYLCTYILCVYVCIMSTYYVFLHWILNLKIFI